MKALTLALTELRRFRGGLLGLLPIGLLLLPLLYGGLYLWANWDPYGRLDQIPVAVVNTDKPVTAEGRKVNGGELLVEQLEQGDLFDWQYVGSDEAIDGLRSGRYYFTITVPSDFSAKLVSPSGDRPQRAQVLITLNDAHGYIVGMMAKTVESELQRQINTAATTAYAQYALGDLTTLGDRVKQAADGATSLHDGLVTAKQGSANLVSGLTELDSGAAELVSANQQIAQGNKQIADLVDSVAGTASDALPAVANQAVAAAKTLQRAADAVAAATGAAKTQTAAVVTDLQDLAAKYPDIADDPLYQRALQSAQQAATAADEIDSDAQATATQAKQGVTAAEELRDSVGSLQDKLAASTSQVDQLATGSQQAYEGAKSLKTGLDSALTGAKKLDTGLVTAEDGSGQLAAGLTAASKRIPSLDADEREKAADVIGSPSDLKESNLNPAKVYGRGLAPFFFAIALWVFALLAFQYFRASNPRALAGNVGAFNLALAGWLPVTGAGVLGALILYVVAWAGLGLDPLNPLGTFGLLALAVGAFVAMTLVLRLLLGLAGTALALVLLMLQLTACGGLYPIETSPGFFQALHPIMPMTYLVNGLRVTISGGESGQLWQAAGVLAGVLVAFLLLGTLIVSRHREWTMRRLRPDTADAA